MYYSNLQFHSSYLFVLSSVFHNFQQKFVFTSHGLIISFILFVNWIILLFLFLYACKNTDKFCTSVFLLIVSLDWILSAIIALIDIELLLYIRSPCQKSGNIMLLLECFYFLLLHFLLNIDRQINRNSESRYT